MSDPGLNAGPTDSSGKLSEAIREVKNAAADRDDVVVELREASRMRLELLAQELEPVFADVPEDDAQFDFAISSGLQPRLWIDATSHVSLGRDRRTYRFLKDTRLGRIVLAESSDMEPVVEQVTRYVAQRIVERQRLLEGDLLPLRQQNVNAREAQPRRNEDAFGAVLSGIGLIFAGALVGAALAIAWFWDRLEPFILD
jgi:hypothetical protein